ncbi:MAG: hypothetical protein NTZ80_00240 [Patescibacteria group bacterium]|nr:hypothetical protein [Patescibacteria group bacterium]
MFKRIISIFLFLIIIFASIQIANAYVNVKGYFRSNGTYVAPHVRSNPNGLKSDNYGWTQSQGTYNKTYGTKGAKWDTPTYITDPDYYEGKNIYDSINEGGASADIGFPNFDINQILCGPNQTWGADGKCYCNNGYLSFNNSCITYDQACKIVYGSNSYGAGNNCACNAGYKWSSNMATCEKIVAICGENSYEVLRGFCKCKGGYKWRHPNNHRTGCIVK